MIQLISKSSNTYLPAEIHSLHFFAWALRINLDTSAFRCTCIAIGFVVTTADRIILHGADTICNWLLYTPFGDATA